MTNKDFLIQMEESKQLSKSSYEFFKNSSVYSVMKSHNIPDDFMKIIFACGFRSGITYEYHTPIYEKLIQEDSK